MEKVISVPTGKILVINGEYGQLECLSLGDYGKHVNVKADFLGITREINGVPNGDIMSLEEKWVVTISTQYGCSMGCKFCDVPKVGPGKNVTLRDLHTQVHAALSIYPEVKRTKRLNIHYARMGEPTFNTEVLTHAKQVKDNITSRIDALVHPVVSTMMPRSNKNLERFLVNWCDIKNTLYKGNAGLQLSINSTDEKQREWMFNGSALSLLEIEKICSRLPNPVGRKYALNFALADDYKIDGRELSKLFDTDKFMCKITPIHETKTSKQYRIKTSNGYETYTAYKDAEQSLKDAGFDVLVFVPSYDEDLGLITCGNAVLSGRLPECEYKVER